MIEPVLQAYELPSVDSVERKGSSGGYSGSEVWKICCGNKSFCLKSWPESFQDEERISWIHRVLLFAKANGCPEISSPILNKYSKTFCWHQNRFWELSEWALGISFENLVDEQPKWNSAINTTIRFHQATARFHFNFGESNNLKLVLNRLRNWKSEVALLTNNFKSTDLILEQQFSRFIEDSPKLSRNLLSQFQSLESLTFPIQPVVRDLRFEHFYFDADRVTALIDFGAMRIDSVACDLARLLGSMLDGDQAKIDFCLNQYANSRPLNENEIQLIFCLLYSSSMIGIANWLTWILVDGRNFESSSEVKSRISQLFDRFSRTVRPIQI